MEESPQWTGRQDYKDSGSLNHSRLTPKAQQTWGGLTLVKTSAEMQSRSKSRGWRGEPAQQLKALAAPPRMWVPFPTPTW